MRTLIAALAFAALASAANTHVVGNVRNADGSPAAGIVVLTWQTFSAADHTIYRPGSLTIPIRAGRIDVQLASGYYAAAWGGSGQTQTEYLYIPPTGSPVQFDTTFLTSLTKLAVGLLSQGGAAEGQVLTWSSGSWRPATPTGGSGGGGAPATYTATLSGSTTLLVTGAAHGLGTRGITVTCWDTAVPPHQVEPDTVTVDASNFNATVTFAQAQDGICILAAGGNTSLALGSYTASFTNATTINIPASTHHLTIPVIIVVCTDAASPPNVIESDHITVDQSTHDVTIYFLTGQTGSCTLR